MERKEEGKPEELKVVHSQHARILKEDEEVWISSEDLNTENSSDDDRSRNRHAFKKKLKLKNRKRSSPNIRLQRPSISSTVPSTSRDLDDRLLMPVTSDDVHSRSTDDSRTSDEESYVPPISAECLSKRLSLEDWRPMKGALNKSSLEESSSAAGDARKIVNEAGNFYDAMLDKLKSLKSCSALRTLPKEKLEVTELPLEKTFKYLKNTPDLKQKLDFINKLDEEISVAINRYKAERDERLSVELEMCRSISSGKLAEERDTERFLKMCNFKGRLSIYRDEANKAAVAQEIEESEDKLMAADVRHNVGEVIPSYTTNFVSRNIQAAKEGLMACFSITDEEKAKIANILTDIDDYQLDDAALALSSSGSFADDTQCELAEVQDNAYSLSGQDISRLGQIDADLEKFNEDHYSPENPEKSIAPVKDEEFWKKFVLDQSLKAIDDQLEKLYTSYLEDEEKLKMNNQREDQEMPDEEVEDLEAGRPYEI